MNAKQKEYFRLKLQNWKMDIHKESSETLENLQDSTAPADVSDRATQESEKTLELRTRDRQRKLVAKIDAALQRIETGTYGYCEITGEPINIARLDARPVTTLSIEAQEMHERNEKLHSDD
jgi:DnaK suppressor protein